MKQAVSNGENILLLPSAGSFKAFSKDPSYKPKWDPQNQSYVFQGNKNLLESDGTVLYETYIRSTSTQDEAALFSNPLYFDTAGLTQNDVPPLLRKQIETLFQKNDRSPQEKIASLSYIVQNIIEYSKKRDERPALVGEARRTGTHLQKLFLEKLKIEKKDGTLILKKKPYGVCVSYAELFVFLVRLLGQGETKLPSRYVHGYMSHEGIIESTDAHAWAQVYFPKLGWVDFEPTGQDRIGRISNRRGNHRNDNEKELIFVGDLSPESQSWGKDFLSFVQPELGEEDSSFSHSENGFGLFKDLFGEQKSDGPYKIHDEALKKKFFELYPILTWEKVLQDKTLQTAIKKLPHQWTLPGDGKPATIDLKKYLLSLPFESPVQWEKKLLGAMQFLERLFHESNNIRIAEDFLIITFHLPHIKQFKKIEWGKIIRIFNALKSQKHSSENTIFY